jgi:hypothetical protein
MLTRLGHAPKAPIATKGNKLTAADIRAGIVEGALLRTPVSIAKVAIIETLFLIL